MVLDSFRKLDKISKPINWPKSINVINLKYLTVSGIVATIGLVHKVEYLSA